MNIHIYHLFLEVASDFNHRYFHSIIIELKKMDLEFYLQFIILVCLDFGYFVKYKQTLTNPAALNTLMAKWSQSHSAVKLLFVLKML